MTFLLHPMSKLRHAVFFSTSGYALAAAFMSISTPLTWVLSSLINVDFVCLITIS